VRPWTHTENVCLRMGGYLEISDAGRKRSTDSSLIQTTCKRRAPPDNKEKESNEFKGADNLYPAGYYNHELKGVNVDCLSDGSSHDVTPRGRGRPAKVLNHCTTARIQRRCQELTILLGFVDEERLELITTVRDQGRALVALSSSRRQMDKLKIKAAALEEQTVIAADKFLEAQEQVDTAMEEASVARDFLRDIIVNNATEITKDATHATEWRIPKKSGPR
jgi:hypothetical protein